MALKKKEKLSRGRKLGVVRVNAKIIFLCTPVYIYKVFHETVASDSLSTELGI
jgi:hypothetical protein